MNYLDMILTESDGRRAATGDGASDSKARASRKARNRNKIKAGSVDTSFSRTKKSAVQIQDEKIRALESMIASGVDSQGHELSPSKIRSLRTKLAAEKAARQEIIKRTGGKNKSSSLRFTSHKDYNSNLDSARSRGASNANSEASSKTQIYTEGFMDALDEMGYFDEDYDDYYDYYDEDDEDEAYLEGYYTALYENGYDI